MRIAQMRHSLRLCRPTCTAVHACGGRMHCLRSQREQEADAAERFKRVTDSLFTGQDTSGLVPGVSFAPPLNYRSV